MKRLLLLALAAGVAVIAWQRIAAEREDRRIWEAVTDPIPDPVQ